MNAIDAIARGETSVSVYGGGTCNSEFEALTGVSMGYIGGVFYPYTFCNFASVDTFPKQFKTLGYDTTAIHPADPGNYSRSKNYPTMGFDEFIDIAGFGGAETLRGHVRDFETYDRIIDRLTERDDPQFVFDLTMMGHGEYNTGLVPEEEDAGYDLGEIFGDELADATNEFLYVVSAADQEIYQFLESLQQIDEPTIVVFFGDHQPGITKDIMEELGGGKAEGVSGFERLFQTRYFIWANYDIAGSAWTEEATSAATESLGADDEDAFISSLPMNGSAIYTGTMSPANLMSWMMVFAGAPLTDFEKASYICRVWIESANINGFMDAEGVWHPLYDADVVTGSEVCEEALQLFSKCAENGLPEPAILLQEDREKSDISAEDDSGITDGQELSRQDAIMVNVMRWITYMNFSERV